MDAGQRPRRAVPAEVHRLHGMEPAGHEDPGRIPEPDRGVGVVGPPDPRTDHRHGHLRRRAEGRPPPRALTHRVRTKRPPAHQTQLPAALAPVLLPLWATDVRQDPPRPRLLRVRAAEGPARPGRPPRQPLGQRGRPRRRTPRVPHRAGLRQLPTHAARRNRRPHRQGRPRRTPGGSPPRRRPSATTSTAADGCCASSRSPTTPTPN